MIVALLINARDIYSIADSLSFTAACYIHWLLSACLLNQVIKRDQSEPCAQRRSRVRRCPKSCHPRPHLRGREISRQTARIHTARSLRPSARPGRGRRAGNEGPDVRIPTRVKCPGCSDRKIMPHGGRPHARRNRYEKPPLRAEGAAMQPGLSRVGRRPGHSYVST